MSVCYFLCSIDMSTAVEFGTQHATRKTQEVGRREKRGTGQVRLSHELNTFQYKKNKQS